jgi:hypothetical protein
MTVTKKFLDSMKERGIGSPTATDLSKKKKSK